MSDYDVIVVGLGAMGSASLYQLARRGARVLGLDRFAPPHTYGSSHGETRITRLVTGEGDAFVPLVRRSHAIWRELEAASGAALFQQTGVLFLSSGAAELLDRVAGVARRADVAHAIYTAAEITARFPQFQVTGDTVALFDPAGGAVFPERCIDVQLQLARRHGAQIQTNETVLDVQPDAGGVVVRTDRGTYRAGQVVLTAGPWLPRLLGGAFPQLLRVYRQVLYWFQPERPADFVPARFPVFIWADHAASAGFYGFPSFAPDGLVKLATSQTIAETSPDAVERDVAPSEVAAMFDAHAAGRLPGLTPRALKTATCLYTVAPDGAFVVDQHPESQRVLLVSACSGHGFKHSAAIGEAVAQRMLTGRSDIDLSSFALARFPELAAAASTPPTGATL